jgi:hypothetical protein
MADEQLTPGTGQGENPEAPGNESGQGFDFERSYNEIRPAYTRATQELAATNERLSAFEDLFTQLHDPDPEVQQAAMDALGFELETGQPNGSAAADPDEWVDPLESKIAELEAFKADVLSRQELEAAEAEDAELLDLRDEYIDAEMETLEELRKEKLSADEQEVLGNLAIAMEGSDGLPDVRGAYQRLYGEKGFLETQRARWIETKRSAAQAPFGVSVPADRKPKTERERAAYYDQRVADLEMQQ